MKVDKNIVTLLNDVLTAELTAVNQYFLHARLCHHWGYDKLYDRVRKESIEEMKHADELIDRILYLEGLPNVQRYGKVNDGIEACRAAGDNGTREMLERMLREEEAHVDWLETQQETIKQIGVERYLSEQLK